MKFDQPPKLNKIPTPDYDSFEGQYERKEKFTINGAEVESVDIKPKNQKDEVPVLVAPGWGATMESFKPGMKVLAEKGRRVISLDQPRKGGEILDAYNQDIEDWYNKKGEKHPDWPAEEVRKAQTMLGFLEQKKLERVDVIAHSEGAINVCIAAMLHPEKFAGRTIVLYSPAGLIGKDNILRLNKGANANKSTTETLSKESLDMIPEDSMRESTKKYLQSPQTEYSKSTGHITPDYLKANPVRAVKELWAISQAQIEDMLRYLRDKSIKVVVVGAVDDTMFPMDKMQQNTQADFVDGFVSVRGGHMQIQVHPEVYMSAVESMLPQPEKK